MFCTFTNSLNALDVCRHILNIKWIWYDITCTGKVLQKRTNLSRQRTIPLLYRIASNLSTKLKDKRLGPIKTPHSAIGIDISQYIIVNSVSEFWVWYPGIIETQVPDVYVIMEFLGFNADSSHNGYSLNNGYHRTYHTTKYLCTTGSQLEARRKKILFLW